MQSQLQLTLRINFPPQPPTAQVQIFFIALTPVYTIPPMTSAMVAMPIKHSLPY